MAMPPSASAIWVLPTPGGPRNSAICFSLINFKEVISRMRNSLILLLKLKSKDSIEVISGNLADFNLD
jgi:hypothetical protein